MKPSPPGATELQPRPENWAWELRKSVMTPSSEEDEFLRVAFAAIPRITEMIAAFPPEHRAGALEVAKWRYMAGGPGFRLYDGGCRAFSGRSYA
jgi:hypothetical protein